MYLYIYFLKKDHAGTLGWKGLISIIESNCGWWMCGGTGVPQNMEDAEVNGIYADIQNPVMIGSITGEKKKKRLDQMKQKVGNDWCVEKGEVPQFNWSVDVWPQGGSRASNTVHLIQGRKSQWQTWATLQSRRLRRSLTVHRNGEEEIDWN